MLKFDAYEAWRDMIVSLSRTLWRCRRTNTVTKTCEAFTKRLRVPRAAYTSTPVVLSDGTDIRLRCQPIVKGTIRHAGDGSAANHFHLSSLPSPSSFSFFVTFFLFFYSTLCAPSFHCQKGKDSSFPLSFATEEYYRREFHNSGILRLRQFRNLSSKFLCFSLEIFQPSNL